MGRRDGRKGGWERGRNGREGWKGGMGGKDEGWEGGTMTTFRLMWLLLGPIPMILFPC